MSDETTMCPNCQTPMVDGVCPNCSAPTTDAPAEATPATGETPAA